MIKATSYKPVFHPGKSMRGRLHVASAEIDLSTLVIAMFISTLILVFSAPPAFGHGGKKHADDAFTQLQALKKATELYDRLLLAGKLDESWETELAVIRVSISEAKESVVSFERDTGDPSTVYFFFDPSGKYVGSNFTGP